MFVRWQQSRLEKWRLPDDVVGELQTLQAQILQLPAVTHDALQRCGGDDGAGKVHHNDLQRAAQQKRQSKAIKRFYYCRNTRISYLKLNV